MQVKDMTTLHPGIEAVSADLVFMPLAPKDFAAEQSRERGGSEAAECKQLLKSSDSTLTPVFGTSSSEVSEFQFEDKGGERELGDAGVGDEISTLWHR